MILKAVDHSENKCRCQNLNLGSTSSQTATWIFYIHVWLGAWCVCIYVISALHLLTGLVPEWKKKMPYGLPDLLYLQIWWLWSAELWIQDWLFHIILWLNIYIPSHSKWPKTLFFSIVSMLIIFQNTCCNTQPVLCVLLGTMRT